jgi:hypothetical protein
MRICYSNSTNISETYDVLVNSRFHWLLLVKPKIHKTVWSNPDGIAAAPHENRLFAQYLSHNTFWIRATDFTTN